MKSLTPKVREEIEQELLSIPEEFQKDFNSTHEGYAVLLEEVDELWDEVKHGEKRAFSCDSFGTLVSAESAKSIHKSRMRNEAVQVAAMAIRFIQELT